MDFLGTHSELLEVFWELAKLQFDKLGAVFTLRMPLSTHSHCCMTTFCISVRSVSSKTNETNVYLPLDWFINNKLKQQKILLRSLALT